MTVELILGDYLEVMRGMKDGSVDLTFIDPPYNVGKDYGDYKDNLPESEYKNWCVCWMNEIKRISKKIAIYPPKKHFLFFWNLLPENHQIVMPWTPEGAIRSGYIHQYASILAPEKPTKRIKDSWLNPQVPGLGYFFRENNYDHPGYTSHDITSRVIDAFLMPGDVVMDCFMGTGTTGVVALNGNRSFIGIEQEQKWFYLAERRIKEAQLQPNLFTSKED